MRADEVIKIGSDLLKKRIQSHILDPNYYCQKYSINLEKKS